MTPPRVSATLEELSEAWTVCEEPFEEIGSGAAAWICLASVLTTTLSFLYLIPR
jgi:hypothetical protein